MTSTADGAHAVELARLITGRPPESTLIRKALAARIGVSSPCDDFGLAACSATALLLLERLRARLTPEETALVDALLYDTAGPPPETYETNRLRVHYRTTGESAVPPDRDRTAIYEPGTTTQIGEIGGESVPVYVERAAFWLERGLDRFVSAPFCMTSPVPAPGLRIDVHLVRGHPGAVAGVIRLPNRAHPDLLASFAVHEMFHVVQFAHTHGSGFWTGERPSPGKWGNALFEGGATFAEDLVVDHINRYLHEADATRCNHAGVLAMPEQAVDTSRYKASLLWRYLAEQLAGPGQPLDPRAYREILDRCADGGNRLEDVEEATRALFAPRHFATASRAGEDVIVESCLLGDFGAALYLKDATCGDDPRFRFAENDAPVLWSSIYPAESPVKRVRRVALAADGPLEADGRVATTSAHVVALGHRYFVLTPAEAVTDVEITVTAEARLTGFAQIAALDTEGALVGLYRSTHLPYRWRGCTTRSGVRVETLAVIVTGVAGRGIVTVEARAAEPMADVVVTRWNCDAGDSHECDPRRWTWRSPDIRVADPAGAVRAESDEQLFVTFRNVGGAAANGIEVALAVQGVRSPTEVDTAAWRPVTDASGLVQILHGIALAPGAEYTWRPIWRVPAAGAGDQFCVRAVVTHDGAPPVPARAMSVFRCA